MKMDEAAEIILAGRRMAARTGHTFKADSARCAAFGISAAELKRVEMTVKKIEDYIATQLAGLRSDKIG